MTGALFLPAEDAELVSLRGFAREHANLVEFVEQPGYVYGRNRAAERRIGIVSGGGSGHEPLHAGFVGEGMLDAAVPGRVFASPHNRQVFEASLEVAGPSGVLHIVKNYTGDRINFGIAAERLRDRGIAVERVLVDDDIATESDDTATGRRGTAATFLIEKILGAAADSGLELAELAELGRNLAAKARSIAVASRAHTTMHGGQAFELAAGQLEYGVGIHGERAQQSIDAPDVRTLVARMVGELLVHIEPRGGVSDALLLLVNGLGATTQLELSAVAELAAEALDEAGAPASELCTGTFVPALNMSGFSLTLLPLGEAERGWWHAPCTTPAWRQS